MNSPSGQAAAMEEICAETYHLVRREAQRLAWATNTLHLIDDLVQYGTVGLLEARSRYDPGRGLPLRAFARPRIRGAMLDGLRKLLPRGRRGHQLRRREYAEPTARPTVQVEAIGFLMETTVGSCSRTPPDPEALLIAESDLQRVRQLLQDLSDEEQAVIVAVYDFDEAGDNGSALAKRRGLSRSAISRRHQRILGQLRERFGEARHG